MSEYQKKKKARPCHGKWRTQKGQALIEAALVILLVLLPLTFGIIEFGRALYIKNMLGNAAREGARRAVVTPLPWNNPKMMTLRDSINDAIPTDWTTTKYVGVNITTPTTILGSGTLPSPVPVSGNGDTVSIRVAMPFTPIAGTIIPQLKNITLVGQASMRYEQ